MKRQSLLLLSVILFWVMLSCTTKKKEESVVLQSSSLNLQAMAAKIMERAKLTPGEVVFMVGKPGKFDSLIVILEQKFKEAGVVYLGTVNIGNDPWPASWDTDFVKSLKGKKKEEIVPDLNMIDLGIMLPGAVPADPPYGAWQEVLKSGKGRAIHFHWAGVFDYHTAGLPMDSLDDLQYQEAILNADYSEINSLQTSFEESARNGRITVTANGGSISFSIGDRPVTKQDGDASKSHSLKARNLIDREVELPAGAIRVAPIEESVEGTMAFPDANWGDVEVEGLVITFSKGKITDIKATKGLDSLKSWLDPSKNPYMLREFALGFNPLLINHSDRQKILHYGYGSGVVRISFGNSAELGGKVGGDLVMLNFFVDATVSVGKEVWVDKGILTKSK